MNVFGLMLVRNAADLVPVTVRHHLALGLDRLLVVDNGSDDETPRVLRRLASDSRVLWTREPGAYLQPQITTELAAEARRRGADWVLPVDADELWHAPGGDLRRVLAATTAGALRVEVVNFVQRREQLETTPDALLHMTRRPPHPRGTRETARELVESGEIAFVEHVYAPKHVCRAGRDLVIHKGNHEVAGVEGPIEPTAEIRCLHAPLRSHAELLAKAADFGARVEELPVEQRHDWHFLRWHRMLAAARLDAEWRANSYADDRLDLGERLHPLVVDTTLADLARPWIEASRRGARVALPGGAGAPRAEEKPDELVRGLLERIEGIEGFLEEPEATLLMQAALVAAAAPGGPALVEVGSYCGRSTVALAAMARAAGATAPVVAIDPHEGELSYGDEVIRRAPTLDALRRNLADAGLTDAVEVVVGRSYEVPWQRPVGLLFLDGLHDEGNVRRDLEHFEPWLAPGALVAFDDYHPDFPGVGAVIDQRLASGGYRELARAGRLVVLERLGPGADRAEAGSLDRIAERGVGGRAGAVYAALAGARRAVRSPGGVSGSFALSLVEILEVVHPPRTEGLLWGASVDQPQTGERGGLSGFPIAGWALGRHAAVERIEIVVGGRVRERLRPDHPRPDVAAAFPSVPGAAVSGFQARVAVAGEGDLDILVRAVLADGLQVPIAILRARQGDRRPGPLPAPSGRPARPSDPRRWTLSLDARELESLLAGRAARARRARVARRSPAVATIAARNYLAQARVALRSYLDHHPDGRGYVLVLDGLPPGVEPGIDRVHVVPPEEIAALGDPGFRFKYGVTELATAVKPALLSLLLHHYGEEEVVYLDPDVLVLRRFDEIRAPLSDGGFVLTPQLLAPLPMDGLSPNETDLLIGGVHNLGFLAVRRGHEVDAMLGWWGERLRDGCRDNPMQGLFVDQKWMDLAPSYFASAVLLRDPTYNVAQWNLGERKVERIGERWAVAGRPIAFFHFSTLDPVEGAFRPRDQNRTSIEPGTPLDDLVADYRARLGAAGLEECRTWEYGYGRFSDGRRVPDLLRGVYLRLDEARRADFADPFRSGESSFVEWACTRDLSAGGLSPLLDALYEARPDARAVFPDPRGVHRRAFVRWARTSAAGEMGFDPSLVPGGEPRFAAGPELDARHRVLEVLEVEVLPLDSAALAGRSLDLPRVGDRHDSRVLDIEGWVVGRDVPATAVEVCHRGRVVARSAIGIARPDVAAALGSAAAGSGFGLVVRTAGLDDLQLEVRAVLADQRRPPLAKVRAARRWVGSGAARAPLVSVVIPCFEQARFLADALDSVVEQTYPHLEIVVVDDGSSDRTSEVAAQIPGVRCVRQDNAGLAAARNAGIRHSNGDLLIFLDADDLLLPDAVETALEALAASPQCGLVTGHARLVGITGAPSRHRGPECPAEPSYAALLRGWCPQMPAVVAFRRAALEQVGVFDSTWDACADYEMYLRVARVAPVCCHHGVVAEYRRHGGNMTRDPALMLRSVLAVLTAQRDRLRGPEERADLEAGRRFWQEHFGPHLADEVGRRVRHGELRGALDALRTLLRHDRRRLGRALAAASGRTPPPPE